MRFSLKLVVIQTLLASLAFLQNETFFISFKHCDLNWKVTQKPGSSIIRLYLLHIFVKSYKKGIRNKSFLPVKKPVAALKLVPIRYASSKRHLPDWTALAFAPLAPSPFRPIRSRLATNSGQVRLVGFQFSDDFWGINRHAASMTWLWPTLEQIWWDQCRSAGILSKVSYIIWLDGAFVCRT